MGLIRQFFSSNFSLKFWLSAPHEGVNLHRKFHPPRTPRTQVTGRQTWPEPAADAHTHTHLEIHKKLRDKKNRPDQTRRRRTIALHPVLHYVPAGCKKPQKYSFNRSWMQFSKSFFFFWFLTLSPLEHAPNDWTFLARSNASRFRRVRAILEKKLLIIFHTV